MRSQCHHQWALLALTVVLVMFAVQAADPKPDAAGAEKLRAEAAAAQAVVDKAATAIPEAAPAPLKEAITAAHAARRAEIAAMQKLADAMAAGTPEPLKAAKAERQKCSDLRQRADTVREMRQKEFTITADAQAANVKARKDATPGVLTKLDAWMQAAQAAAAAYATVATTATPEATNEAIDEAKGRAVVAEAQAEIAKREFTVAGDEARSEADLAKVGNPPELKAKFDAIKELDKQLLEAERQRIEGTAKAQALQAQVRAQAKLLQQALQQAQEAAKKAAQDAKKAAAPAAGKAAAPAAGKAAAK